MNLSATRMQSSRMRTGRSLTVCWSLLVQGASFLGGVPPSQGVSFLGGVYFGGSFLEGLLLGGLLVGSLLVGGLLVGRLLVGGASFWGGASFPPSQGCLLLGGLLLGGCPSWGCLFPRSTPSRGVLLLGFLGGASFGGVPPSREVSFLGGTSFLGGLLLGGPPSRRPSPLTE